MEARSTMKSTGRPAPPATEKSNHAHRDSTSQGADPGEQLRLQFFAAINGYDGTPPDRALMRVLLDCALKGVDRFTVGKRTIAAAVVDHVAVRLYLRSNRAGIVSGFSVKVIAADVKRDPCTVKMALAVLRRLLVFRSTRAADGNVKGLRKPAIHRLNIGGLDWPAVRERVKEAAASGRTTQPLTLSGRTTQPLSGRTTQPLKGYDVGHDVRTTGSEKDLETPMLGLEIAREAAPAFDPGSAFAPVASGLCPSCGRFETEAGALCSDCSPSRASSARDAEPAYLASGTYGGRPSADWNAGGDP